MTPNPQPVTKEALVEEFKKIRLINGDEANGVIEDGTQLIQWLSTALDRYGTAQRAEGAREAREEIRAYVLELIGDDPYKHTLTEVRIVERLTPTETDKHETV